MSVFVAMAHVHALLAVDPKPRPVKAEAGKAAPGDEGADQLLVGVAGVAGGQERTVAAVPG